MARSSFILGTAGHIDHGKSTLILALTGTDPDRLPDEKRRGITIELGFAQLQLPGGLSMGVVDVPGHENFIRQMIAGATGVDLALLCVAADDGVMPQTLEHLSVLELLGVRQCVVALTKCDLVDDEWVEFVSDEVANVLAGGPFANSPIVPVAAREGRGLDELRNVLAEAIRGKERATRRGGVRLPVDRAFTIKGAGTVITGTLWSGEVRAGDRVKVLPSGLETRVRSVQVHGQEQEVALPSQRVALNLNAVTPEEVAPGSMICGLDAAPATDRFDARLTYLGAPEWMRDLASGTRVHVAHGTREVVGRVLLMGGQAALEPGQAAYAQIRLDEPLPVAWLDRFIVRSLSPMHVVGGGTVLRAHPRRKTNLSTAEFELLAALESADEGRVAAAAFALATLPLTAEKLAETCGLTCENAAEQLGSLVASRRAVEFGGGFFTTASFLQKAQARIENELKRFHSAEPAEPGMPREALRKKTFAGMNAATFAALLEREAAAGRVVLDGNLVAHPSAGAAAAALARQDAAVLEALLKAAGTQPPTVEELTAQAALPSSRVWRALNFLEDEGVATQVNLVLFFHNDALAQLEAMLRAHLTGGQAATAAELKDAMQTTRKYAIPLLEFFDTRGVTKREGDKRRLA